MAIPQPLQRRRLRVVACEAAGAARSRRRHARAGVLTGRGSGSGAKADRGTSPAPAHAPAVLPVARRSLVLGKKGGAKPGVPLKQIPLRRGRSTTRPGSHPPAPIPLFF